MEAQGQGVARGTRSAVPRAAGRPPRQELQRVHCVWQSLLIFEQMGMGAGLGEAKLQGLRSERKGSVRGALLQEPLTVKGRSEVGWQLGEGRIKGWRSVIIIRKKQGSSF